MIRLGRPLALAGLCLGLTAGDAAAGQSVCWIQNGVLLVPAAAAGVNGVFILDTGAAQSQLDATQASEADLSGDAATGAVQVAGRVFPGLSMQILALDERTRAFPTPIAGVLGADILAGQVLSVRPSPCRLSLSPSSKGTGRGRPMVLKAGVPFVRAGITDGALSREGAFRIDTGSPAPIALAAAPPGQRLRALSLDGRLFENIVAIPHPDAADDALGAIGEPIWSRFSIRLDFGRRTLTLTPP